MSKSSSNKASRTVAGKAMRLALTGALIAIASLMAPAAALATTPAPDMVAAAQQIQKGCVARGEDARVCACGVGLAYAQLQPATFKLIPEVAPLLEEKDKMAAVSGLIAAGQKSGLSISDLNAAYETIKANRETTRAICKPLSAIAATKKK